MRLTTHVPLSRDALPTQRIGNFTRSATVSPEVSPQKEAPEITRTQKNPEVARLIGRLKELDFFSRHGGLGDVWEEYASILMKLKALDLPLPPLRGTL